MGIIVQKFGGTSVGTGERMRQVADIIQRTRKKKGVIAVVSAMSGTVKAEGTTNLLLEAGNLAAQAADFNVPLDKLEAGHRRAIGEAVGAPELRGEVERWIEAELAWLRSFLDALRVIRELSPRSQDILMATGERFSAYLLSAVLRDRAVPTSFVDLTQVVPEEETEVTPGFFRRLQERLAATCAPKNGEVPVVTGFFGMVPGGLLRAVGRGYTDFTAALISAGLGKKKVDEMQVWKEVDGVFTADPRRVPTARVLPSISPMEASELTYFGSEVMHPFTMERVVAAEVPIRIKNTFNPDAPGTVILPRARAGDLPQRVTAVTAKKGITIFTITSNRMYNAYGFMARVFDVLNANNVVVDLIATSEVSLSFTVDRREELEHALPQLRELGQVLVTPGRAILAMVGEGMKYAKGTAGGMFTSLGAAGVNIEMISQGASEINISCVIKEEDAEAGLKAVHRAFLEDAQDAQ
jgi:aspartate kinase